MRDLNDLYYFVQVVDHHGFAPAARALGMQKSKLSRRIAALEDQLGTRLIQRSSRKFSVTEIGQAYYQHCLAMLVEAEAAQALIDGARSEPCGTIRVACAPGLLTYQMSGLIVRFMALYPELEVQLHSTSRRVDVIGEGFDLAIRVREPPLEQTDLVMRKLDESVHRLVASPDLIARMGAPAGPADLANWPSLDFGPAHRDHVWALTHKDGMTASVRHAPRLVTDDLHMLHEGALQGLGVALLPSVAVMHDLEGGRLVDLLPDWRPKKWIVHAVFPSRRGLLPSVRMLLDFLVEGCAEQRIHGERLSSPDTATLAETKD
ncbi:LysR substrate-binding domain-containing protein [Brevundimonas guildfordensis]|uniref:LysR family transcriptional regulator n=1 Tax=Brevundimonas guildfordensis TaxID=2762241 RepID=A0ABR8QWD5_9CAUL|nr:LysR substrate-binding domain-containing protein [Brevundimonas guildfordensis]MBD7939851.1 LysR family transcriptional regulator [Brevundimonas guildfordensis]